MIEQMRERRAHGMVVLRAHQHIAIRRADLLRQRLQIRRRCATRIGEVRLEYRVEFAIQRIDQLHRMLGMMALKVRDTGTCHAQAETGGCGRRAVADTAEENQKLHGNLIRHFVLWELACKR